MPCDVLWRETRGEEERVEEETGEESFCFYSIYLYGIFFPQQSIRDTCFEDATHSLFLLIKTFGIINSWNDRRQ